MKILRSLLFLMLLMTISLTSNAQMTVGSMVVGQGVSTTAWQNYFNQGIFIDVNTAACGFTSTPHYLVTLENGSSRWQISGVPSVYNATPTSFRVYLRWTDSPGDSPTIGLNMDANPLTPATATGYGWVIRWTAISVGPCDQCGANSTGRSFSDENPQSSFLEPDLGKDHTENSIQEVNVFPNPTQTRLNIKTTAKFKSCEVYDLNGQLLIKTSDNSIDVEELKSGNYAIRIIFDNSSVTKQFTKL